MLVSMSEEKIVAVRDLLGDKRKAANEVDVDADVADALDRGEPVTVRGYAHGGRQRPRRRST